MTLKQDEYPTEWEFRGGHFNDDLYDKVKKEKAIREFIADHEATTPDELDIMLQRRLIEIEAIKKLIELKRD